MMLAVCDLQLPMLRGTSLMGQCPTPSNKRAAMAAQASTSDMDHDWNLNTQLKVKENNSNPKCGCVAAGMRNVVCTNVCWYPPYTQQCHSDWSKYAPRWLLFISVSWHVHMRVDAWCLGKPNWKQACLVKVFCKKLGVWSFPASSYTWHTRHNWRCTACIPECINVHNVSQPGPLLVRRLLPQWLPPQTQTWQRLSGNGGSCCYGKCPRSMFLSWCLSGHGHLPASPPHIHTPCSLMSAWSEDC